MICILHGYLLEGSGSNLWTRAIVQSLCRQGETVHLMAQENHPGRYEFITEARRYLPDGTVETIYQQESPHPGCCILHKPQLGDTLPVYVRDDYEEFSRVVPMVDLPDADIAEYLERNVQALSRIIRENGITALHANHAVLMSVVAQRAGEAAGVPFAIMPHGSAIEYAVKKDPRFHLLATDAFSAASRVFVIGDEMRGRVQDVFGGIPNLADKLTELHLGVDTALFEPLPRTRRAANIQRLAEAVAPLATGKRPKQTERLRDGLSGDVGRAGLLDLFAATSDYDAKVPDAGLAETLAAVDWERDPTLLFVGRLISAKGLQEIIAALPLILARIPDLRLLVVGHGPARQPIEAMLWALEHGEQELFENVVAWGRALEGDPAGETEAEMFQKVRCFLDDLVVRGETDAYFQAARQRVRRERVIFTGYLTHSELQHLFPCADAAIFPSVVREAGPLVFLEALAAGVFPMGTYFGGMQASIDAVSNALPAADAACMKLSPEPARTVADIAANVPTALHVGPRHRSTLREVAVTRYDWRSVAGKLAAELAAMQHAAESPAGDPAGGANA